MYYNDIFDRRNEIMESVEIEEGVSLALGAGAAAGIAAGSAIAMLAGKAITKQFTKKRIREVINNGSITKDTITKGIKECQNPKQLKQIKKCLRI